MSGIARILILLGCAGCPKQSSAQVPWEDASKQTMVLASYRAMQCGFIDEEDHDYLINVETEHQKAVVGILPAKCESVPREVIDRCAAWARSVRCETLMQELADGPCSQICDR